MQDCASIRPFTGERFITLQSVLIEIPRHPKSLMGPAPSTVAPPKPKLASAKKPSMSRRCAVRLVDAPPRFSGVSGGRR